MPMRPRSGSARMQRQRKSWVELLARRGLEGEDLASLRVDARHDVLDRAVLAGGIHRLEDEEHGPAVLGVELVLSSASASTPRASHSRARGLSSLSKPAVSPGSKSVRRKPAPSATRYGRTKRLAVSISSWVSMRQLRSDELVKIKVEVPTKLNDRQKQLLKEFAELSGEKKKGKGFLNF